ncbi:MAG: hypothetical protein IJ797_10875 [Selenomonadaceae bacterium]|nr:hypothetical protein [Selenomonadaceae bacterium]
MNIERELKEVDFSKFSKIKESLFQSLLENRGKKRELDFEELDYASAAGVNHAEKKYDEDE